MFFYNFICNILVIFILSATNIDILVDIFNFFLSTFLVFLKKLYIFYLHSKITLKSNSKIMIKIS